MKSLDDARELKAMFDWQLQQACKRHVSFRYLALASSSRLAIATATCERSDLHRAIKVRARE